MEVEVVLHTGVRGRASVPSGASTGTHEAHELRDGMSRRSTDSASRQPWTMSTARSPKRCVASTSRTNAP